MPVSERTFSTERALGKRRVQIEILEESTENIDAFMTEGDGERPWEVFELTQSQDVRKWIAEPKEIRKIQPMLLDLARRVETLPRPVRILDAGCYGGYVYDYLDKHVFKSRKDFTYHGIDVQQGAVNAARLLHEDCENASFETGDIYNLVTSFGAGAFDVVLCYRVLIHIPYFEKCVRNLSTVSRYFAHTALWLRDKPTCRRCREIDQGTGNQVTYYQRWVTPDQVENAAEAAGVDSQVTKQSNDPLDYVTVTFSHQKRERN